MELTDPSQSGVGQLVGQPPDARDNTKAGTRDDRRNIEQLLESHCVESGLACYEALQERGSRCGAGPRFVLLPVLGWSPMNGEVTAAAQWPHRVQQGDVGASRGEQGRIQEYRDRPKSTRTDAENKCRVQENRARSRSTETARGDRRQTQEIRGEPRRTMTGPGELRRTQAQIQELRYGSETAETDPGVHVQRQIQEYMYRDRSRSTGAGLEGQKRS
ncbi:hypothetical protein BaRGS_00005784 [Batillaria attramentaria]|uniref:Uncharacterized protein n=1 Tax=Batillaria attramentaria TaxID=370345 RepID=A0ABD0LVC5_9CAEN